MWWKGVEGERPYPYAVLHFCHLPWVILPGQPNPCDCCHVIWWLSETWNQRSWRRTGSCSCKSVCQLSSFLASSSFLPLSLLHLQAVPYFNHLHYIPHHHQHHPLHQFFITILFILSSLSSSSVVITFHFPVIFSILCILSFLVSLILKEEQERQIAMLEEMMNRSPSLLSEISHIAPPDHENLTPKFGLGLEPRLSFSNREGREVREIDWIIFWSFWSSSGAFLVPLLQWSGIQYHSISISVD